MIRNILGKPVALLACVLLVITNIGYAALPTLEIIEEQVDLFSEESSADANIIHKLQQIKGNLQEIKELQQKNAGLQEIIEEAPQRKIALYNKLQQAVDAQPDNISKSALPGEIEQKLATEKARNKEGLEQLAQLNKQQQTLLEAQETLPVAIAGQEQILAKKIKDNKPLSASADSKVDNWLLESGLILQEKKLKWLNLRQDTLMQRKELAKIQIQILEYQSILAAKQIALLQARLLEVSTQSSLKVIEQAKRLSRVLEDAPPAIKQWNSKNEVLAVESEALNRQLLLTQQDRQQLGTQRQRITQNLAQIKSNIKWLKSSPVFSDAIRAQLQLLPDFSDKSNLAKTITAAHLQHFQLSVELAKLKDIPSLINQIAEESGLNELHKNALSGIMHFRYEVLTDMLEKNDQFIAEITRLDALQDQFAEEMQEERNFLREKQLFIRDRAQLWELYTLDMNAWLGTDNMSQRVRSILRSAAFYGDELLLLGGLLALFSGLILQIVKLENGCRLMYAKMVGKVRKDAFFHTLILVVLALSQGALLAFSLYIIGWWTGYRLSSFYSYDVENIFVASCSVIFIWESLARMAMPEGLLELHFACPKAIIERLKSALTRQRWIIYTLLLSMIFSKMISVETESLLLRMEFIALMLWMIGITLRLLKHHYLPALLPVFAQSQAVWQLSRAVFVLPLIAITMLAVWGYFYGAKVALYYYYAALLSFGCAWFLQQLGVRWLNIEQRNLALQRALEKREEQLQRDKSVSQMAEEVDEAVLCVEEVSEQSLTLLNLVVVVFLFTMLSTLLFDKLVALQWMNEITIWEVVTATEAGNIIEYISLKEVLSALIILGISLFSAKNLPGLLELLVLRHLSISTGAAYATTTLLRYALVLSGFLIGISILGFHWSKLQWLVAALSVGLGFGLQEIFANLVSGIILLFERPIRVGDTITIQNLSGVVTRINTRATTILDWDKKEIVVPNKALITGQLVNWSLSDATTRVIIPVGVAYGSDVALVRKLLIQAASECDEISQDPTPQALFLLFGTSSLDFELRVFLPQVERRVVTQDKLNTRIEQLFREHQVEIPFPQMDIHVRELPRED